MAQINRFYLLISMLVSYRIGAAMANPPSDTLLWFQPQYGSKYLARLNNSNDDDGCHICVPITNISSGSWESEAVEWVDQHANQLIDEEADILSCWSNRYPNTLYSVGSKTRFIKNSWGESVDEFLLCTPQGWKVASYSPGSLWDTECDKIDNKCALSRDTSSNQYRMQGDIEYLDDQLGLGSDYTSEGWQVCMFGKSDSICVTQRKCDNGYYGWGDGACDQCPSPSTYYMAKQSGSTYIKGGNITAMSNGSIGQSTCYVPGSDLYWDTSGVFYFNGSCYY